MKRYLFHTSGKSDEKRTVSSQYHASSSFWWWATVAWPSLSRWHDEAYHLKMNLLPAPTCLSLLPHSTLPVINTSHSVESEAFCPPPCQFCLINSANIQAGRTRCLWQLWQEDKHSLLCMWRREKCIPRLLNIQVYCQAYTFIHFASSGQLALFLSLSKREIWIPTYFRFMYFHVQGVKLVREHTWNKCKYVNICFKGLTSFTGWDGGCES